MTVWPADDYMALFKSILKRLLMKILELLTGVAKDWSMSYSEPTLADWHDILLEQPEDAAQQLQLHDQNKYTRSLKTYFLIKRNVNLDNRLVVFQSKGTR